MPPPARARRATRWPLVAALALVAACTGPPGTSPSPRTSSSAGPSPTAPASEPATPTPTPTSPPTPTSEVPPLPVATTPPADAPAFAGAGNLVVTSADGVVSRVAPGDGTVDPIEGVTGAAQVTSSPDGSTLVFTRVVDGEPTVSILRDDDSTQVAVPTAPYFHLVAPDGSRVASLGDDGDGRVTLLVTDVAAGTSRAVDRGRPYFLSWRGDGGLLAAHVDGEVVATLDPVGDRDPLPLVPGAFQAPAWTDDDRLVVVLQDGAVDTVPVTTRVAAQPATGTLAVVDPADGTSVALAPASGAVAFDVAGDRVAWVAGDSGQAASLGPLRVVGLDGSEPTTISDRDVAMFEWSPDGQRLLFHVVDPDRGFVPHVWDGTAVTAYEPFLPTATLAVQYLPFWPQYVLALTHWAPDGSAFTVVDRGADDGPGSVVVQQLDGRRRVVAPGEAAVWTR